MALEATSWRAAFLVAAAVSVVIGGYRVFFGESRYANKAGILPTCDSPLAAKRLKRVLDALGPAEYVVANGAQVSTGVDNERREMRFCSADISTLGRQGQAAFGLAWGAADKSDITIVIGHGTPL